MSPEKTLSKKGYWTHVILQKVGIPEKFFNCKGQAAIILVDNCKTIQKTVHCDTTVNDIMNVGVYDICENLTKVEGIRIYVPFHPLLSRHPRFLPPRKRD